MVRWLKSLMGTRDAVAPSAGRELPTTADLRARLETLPAGTPGLLVLEIEGLEQAVGTLGGASGRDLSDCVVDRITRALRPGDFLARTGPARFAVLLDAVTEPAIVDAVSARIRGQVGRPFELEGGQLISLAATVGAVHPTSSDPRDSLVGSAQLALFLARETNPGSHQVFQPSIRVAAECELGAASELERAIEEGGIVPWFQPLVDLETGRLVGFEALARWVVGDGRVLPPGAFVPAAEKLGHLVDLDRAVLRQACHAVARWQALPGYEDLYVSVNLCAQQFDRPDLLATVAFAIEDADIKPASLRLELTESSLVGDDRGTIETLEQIVRLGVQLMVDDFGTGWSSLSYLAKFPISVIKIDRSFVAHLDDERQRRIPASILAMAETLEMRAIAEGVETREHYRILRSMGCTTGQGFHFSKPRPADRVLKMLLNQIEANDASPSGAWDLSSIWETDIESI